MNGTTPYEGRVEICYDGVWGSVCDNSWNNWDAAIVCLQMGFQGTSKLQYTSDMDQCLQGVEINIKFLLLGKTDTDNLYDQLFLIISQQMQQLFTILILEMERGLTIWVGSTAVEMKGHY